MQLQVDKFTNTNKHVCREVAMHLAQNLSQDIPQFGNCITI